MAKRGNGLKLLAMLLLGSLIGTIITLLLAPRSGRETRSQLKEKSLKLIGGRAKKKAYLKQLSNWGNYPQVQVEFYEFEDLTTLRALLLHSNG
ncbi:MAG: YtxH domain-containing protein, partial [Nitrososphaera sp.]|nr:YtxH domain-containing protein [Nitrososphaera sp.]